MGLRDDLIAAKALIDTPEKWGKGLNSFSVAPYCAAGAIDCVTRNGAYSAAWKALAACLPDGTPKNDLGQKSIPAFNAPFPTPDFSTGFDNPGQHFGVGSHSQVSHTSRKGQG